MEAPSLARSQKLQLGWLFMHCRQEHFGELGRALDPATPLRLEAALLAAFQGLGARDLKVVISPVYVDRDTICNYEISEDTGKEF